jgi:HEAT repeat protein
MLLLAVVMSGCAPTARPGVEPRRDQSPPSFQEVFFNALLDQWLPGMGAADIRQREQPQQEFERFCFQAGLPGGEADRATLCKVICERLGPQTAKPARVWLLRQLERLSGSESVPTLANLLADPDPEIRDLVRRVLENNPDPDALTAVRDALRHARDPTWQVALINTLGVRGDRDSVPLFIELACRDEAPVAAAAIAALADIGDPQAADTLLALSAGRREARREPAAAALIRIADRLLDAGQPELADGIYLRLCQSEMGTAMRAAALRGLVATEQEQAVPRLVDAIRGKPDPALQLLAVRLLAELPGEIATRRLIEELPGAPAEVQIVLLDALAGRGQRLAKPAVIRALKSDDADVRIAATLAMEKLGDLADVLLLATLAAGTEGAERGAARHSLARLPGDDVDRLILADLNAAVPKLRVELIHALRARWYRPAVPALLAQAGYEDEQVRIAALQALGALSAEGDAPALVKLLVEAQPESVQTAAEDAVVAVCTTRIKDADARAQPVLAAWEPAGPAVRASLVRVLGRVGGSAALKTIRLARESDNADLADAAARALAKWPGVEVLDDLLDLARHSDNKTHRVLALQGYVRLLGLPSERDPQDTLEMYQTAMSLAERAEERKLVLGGLAAVRHLEALRMAEQYLEDAELRAEAEAAVVAVAQLVGALHRPEALAAVEKVIAHTANDTTRQRGEKALGVIRRSAGYVTTWMVCGPYFEAGADWMKVYDGVFAPEQPESADVEWRPLKITNPTEPWVFDLTQLDAGSDRCVYVRSAVWSEKAQDARLEIGSDDGVKVWLNGRLVHQARVARGHTAFQDKVPVQLEAGWNTLLLKVVQASGGWGFSVGVMDPDGEPLSGLEFRAEAPTPP